MASQVGEMNIVLSMNAATYSQAIDQAYKKLDQLAGKSKQVGHSTVTSVQAASGALRELNGDFTNNIRAVERFITTIPGVGDALKNIFPLVGGLAFASMIGAMVVKVYDFAKAGREASKTVRTEFEAINDATRKTGVELDLANDKIENTIAKLERKPENLLKLALDEDRKAAYDLASEVDSASRKVDELLKKNGIGLGKQLGELVLGHNVSITTGSEKVIKDAFTGVRSASRQTVQSEESATPGPDAETKKLASRKAMMDAYAKSIQKVSDELQSVYALQRNDSERTDFSSRTEMLEDSLDQLKSERHNIGAGYQHSDDSVREQADQQAKQRAEDAKRAATAAAEAKRKAAEAQMKGFEGQLAGLKSDHDVATTEEYAFWTGLIAAARQYPDNLLKVQEKIGQIYQAMGKEIEQFARKSEEANKKIVEGRKRDDEVAQRLVDEMDRADHHSADSRAELVAVLDKNANALQEMALAHDVATGAISRHDAAMQTAALHAATYASALAAIQQEKENDDNDGSLTPEQRTANKASRDVRGAAIQGEADRTALQDKWAEFQTTALGGATEALQEFIASAKDSSAQMKAFTEQALKGFNDEVLKALTTHDHNKRQEFSNFGAGLARTVAGTGLQKLEAGGLSSIPGMFGKDGKPSAIAKMLGLDPGDKKPTGAANNPFHTIVMNMPSGGFGNSCGGSGSGGGTGEGGGSGEGGVGGFLAGIVPFLPGFANGVNAFSGGLAIVGEKGPELLHLAPGTNVVPNHKLGAAMSGGETHHHWTINAQGSSDPAQTEAAVNRGIRAAAPHIVAASMYRSQEASKRLPMSVRR